MKEGKIIIFSAPSGAGKTTIVKHLLSRHPDFAFSVSATSRKPRGTEVNGVDYFFISVEEFKSKILNNEFLEWQEVYPDNFYGSLKSEVDRILKNGKNILFDVDVVGGSNIKKHYGNRALALFIQPPSITVLEKRLLARCTEDKEVIRKRVEKAERELTFAHLFDYTIVNDTLEHALQEAEGRVKSFLAG
ncbi:MAG: guanylate kinase [Prolixibacteraceae bacterium]|jgi:guanylate kinase|nr:guanylate kinase [Prolixibacteraceae bacterium]